MQRGKVGIETVVRDSNGDTLMVMEKFQSFIGYVELTKTLTLHEGITNILEVDIYSLRIL